MKEVEWKRQKIMQAELFTSEIMKMYGGKKGVENLALKKQITSFFETK